MVPPFSTITKKLRHPTQTYKYQQLRSVIQNPLVAWHNLMTRVQTWWGRYRFKWSEPTGNRIRHKLYKSYGDYVLSQREKRKRGKISQHELLEHDRKYQGVLRKRLKERDGDIIKPGMTVLCLGARLGTEVKAFFDHGCFAVGIDLEPGEENKYVLFGDFHQIQFPDHSVDIVFTNSLDHVFTFGALMREIKRVLKPGGFFIAEVINGTAHGFVPGFYESAVWEVVDDVINTFLKNGFKLIKRSPIRYPWSVGGEHIAMQLPDHPTASPPATP